MRFGSTKAVLVLLGLLGMAQPIWPAQDTRNLPSPNEMVKTFQSEDESAILRLAKALGLTLPSAPFEEERYCSAYDSAKSYLVVLKRPGPQAVVLLTSTNQCWLGFIIVLRQIRPNEWRHITTFRLGGKYRVPKIEFVNIFSKKESEIIVHMNEVMSGTGMWQYNMMILKLQGDQFQVLFDEPEEVNFSVPSTSDKGFYNTEQTQTSEFSFRHSGETGASLIGIYEKQRIKIHNIRITRWRVFMWDPEIRRFRHLPTDRP